MLREQSKVTNHSVLYGTVPLKEFVRGNRIILAMMPKCPLLQNTWPILSHIPVFDRRIFVNSRNIFKYREFADFKEKSLRREVQ